MRKITPNCPLLFLAISALIILASCNNNNTNIPFPISDSGYAQPVSQPLQLSAPKKLNWVTVKTGGVKSVIKKLDIEALPTTPYNTSGLKPFAALPQEVHFDFNALPDMAFNPDKSASKSLQFKVSFLLPPNVTKVPALTSKNGTTLSIFDLTQSLGVRGKVIFSFFQEKSGLIWIGTSKGLCRFDGEYLQTYPSLRCKGLVEDNQGRIWFINETGIGMIDIQEGLMSFSATILAPFPLLPKMILDNKGSIWVSETASKSVEIINPQKQTYKQLGNNLGISGKNTLGIYQDNKKNIWINTNDGIDIINLEKGKISYLRKINGLQSDTIRAITGDQKGRIWVGARNGGVDLVDIEHGIITNYGVLQGLQNRIYYRLLIDNSDRIWISADQRLALLDPVKGMMKYFAENEGIPHDYNLDLLFDNKQRVWVGTAQTGLYIIDQGGQMVYPLGKKNISTLFEDAAGNIWAGTNSEGIFILNEEKETLRQLNKEQGFDNNTIQSFNQVDGNIWVTSNGGLDIIDQTHKTIEHTGRKEGLISDTVYSILRDARNNIWITGPSGGIEIIDSSKKSIRLATKKDGLSDENLLNIKSDTRGKIWIATYTGGVDVIDPENWTIQYLDKEPGLKDTCYRTLMPDKYGRMWIATDKGIYIADTKRGLITSISTSQGLSNDYVNSLVEYKNYVVAGTYHKVNLIIPPAPADDVNSNSQQGKWMVSTLAKSDGLYISQTLWDVNAITKNGRYLWGDLGITIVNELKEDHDSPSTYITGLNMMNQSHNFSNPLLIGEHDTLWSADTFYVKGQTPANTGFEQKTIFHWDSITGPYNLPANLLIPYDQNYIQFQFAQANLGSADTTLYSYILEGIDKHWSNFANKSYSDNYLNLPPGNYTFKVRSKISSGPWTKPASFSFTITPPWWQTWWAYALYVFCVIAIFYAFVRYRTYQLHVKQKELEIKVEERTQEVKQQAEELLTVNQISQALAAQLNMGDLITLVGDQLLKLFKANIVYLALLDAKKKVINFPYQHGDNMPPMDLGEGLTSKIILTGQSLLINKDVSEKTSELGVNRIGVPSASYLGVPIPVGDEIIGVMSVQSTEMENRFNEKDQRLLTTIAANVGVALKKAGLFEEVKQAKMEAEAARKIAEQANAAKSAFLSTVSHELRTPLTSILGFAKIIKKRLEEKVFPLTDTTDPKTNKTVQQISENLNVVVAEGERLTHLINDVLDLAKIEAGKMEWNMEPAPLPEIVERAIAATTALFDQKNLKLERQIEDGLPEITGDRDKLIQVVVNLLSNAVKFTETGAVTCRAFKKDDTVVVGITDTGIGIAPGDYDAVFEQFKQVGDTLTDKPKGTGLGLPICKEIVEHHGGHIWLESELGKGSTFFFSLPFVKSDSTKKPLAFDDLLRQLKKRVEQSQPSLNGNHANILVVDDEEGIRSLLRQELTEAGYNIEEAANGKEALAKIRKVRPDLILLDVMMPEMNGFDVAAILKNDPQTMDIPIIILSIVQDKARGYRIGVDRYLTKPIDTSLLFTEIGHLLEQGKSRKKVMVVDEDSVTVRTLMEVLQAKGYQVVESDGKELVEKAIANQPDIIILNSILSANQEIVKTLRFEKGLENVLFLIYQ